MEAPVMSSSSSSGDQANRRKRQANHVDSTCKKRRSTSEYMYEELFLNGRHSDITIRALGKDWRLHRGHLCQSDYFSSMFSRKWKESTKNVITIRVPSDVNEEALHTALASLYKDDVDIPTDIVLSILSAASFLQLDSLIDRCSMVMKEAVNAARVCDYLNAAKTYLLQEVQDECLLWLDALFLQPVENRVKFRQEAKTELLEHILQRATLIIPSEGYLFKFIIKFVLTRLEMAATPSKKRKGGGHAGGERNGLGHGQELADERGDGKRFEDEEEVLEGVIKSAIGWEGPLLTLDKGKPFAGLFQKVRLHRLLEQYDWQLLNKIFPKELLLDEYQSLLRGVMSVQAEDARIPRKEKVTAEVFADHCVRCGFCMEDNEKNFYVDGPKYLGWNCGISLAIAYGKKHKTFSWKLKRLSQNECGALCRLQVLVEDKDGAVIRRMRTDICEVKNYKQTAFVIPREVHGEIHRLLIGVEALFVIPPASGEPEVDVEA